jgi:hypothetical protein
MPADFTIDDKATQYLNAPTQVELRASVERYAEHLLREASRLEAAAKSTQGSPEITSTMIKDADILLRRGYVRQQKDPVVIGAQVVSTLGSFVTGLFANSEALRQPTTLVLFIVLLTITITASVVAIMKG